MFFYGIEHSSFPQSGFLAVLWDGALEFSLNYTKLVQQWLTWITAKKLPPVGIEPRIKCSILIVLRQHLVVSLIFIKSYFVDFRDSKM